MLDLMGDKYLQFPMDLFYWGLPSPKRGIEDLNSSISDCFEHSFLDPRMFGSFYS